MSFESMLIRVSLNLLHVLSTSVTTKTFNRVTCLLLEPESKFLEAFLNPIRKLCSERKDLGVTSSDVDESEVIDMAGNRPIIHFLNVGDDHRSGSGNLGI